MDQVIAHIESVYQGQIGIGLSHFLSGKQALLRRGLLAQSCSQSTMPAQLVHVLGGGLAVDIAHTFA